MSRLHSHIVLNGSRYDKQKLSAPILLSKKRGEVLAQTVSVLNREVKASSQDSGRRG